MYILLFVLQTFLPIIQIYGIRIPTSLFFLFIILIRGKININRNYIKGSVVTTVCFFVLTTVMININADIISIKELLYALIPIYTVLNYIIIYNILDKVELSKISNCAKIFLIIQLLFCVIQITGILGINEKLNDIYFFWQKTNAQKDNAYLEITYRPFGTTGSPIYLSIIAYVLGKIVEIIDNKKTFYYLSFIIIMLTGARMAIIAFLLIEIAKLIYKGIKNNPINTIASMFAIVILIALMYNVAPFTRKYIDMFLYNRSELSQDYSVTYRLGMLNEFVENKEFVLLGGKALSSLPEYVDSEYILRILQFGILGFGLCVYPYTYLFNRIKSKKKYEVGFFILIMMITSIVLTNYYYMPFIMIWMVVEAQKQKLEEENEKNCICNN